MFKNIRRLAIGGAVLGIITLISCAIFAIGQLLSNFINLSAFVLALAVLSAAWALGFIFENM